MRLCSESTRYKAPFTAGSLVVVGVKVTLVYVYPYESRFHAVYPRESYFHAEPAAARAVQGSDPAAGNVVGVPSGTASSARFSLFACVATGLTLS
jgi:hypothetical protein